MSSDTESVQPLNNFEKCTVVLLDVLGTTTSINFAKETLFPYVTKHVKEFLKSQWDDKIVKEAIKELNDKELDLESATKAVLELTETGSENKGLKTLQGLIYSRGYNNGELKAHVFFEVPSCLETWSHSRKVAIYSTGSVESQKLLFSNTVGGDVSSHISKYYDQSVGLKTEPDSYKKIVEDFAVKPEEVLFVTDNIEEGKAAKSANLSVVLITREGNDSLPDESKNFVVIASFDEINVDKSSKRKKIEEISTTEEPPTKVAKTENEALPTNREAEKDSTEIESMEVDIPVESKQETKSDGVIVSEVNVTESTPTNTEEQGKTESKEKTDEKRTSSQDAPMVTTITEESETLETTKSDEPKKSEESGIVTKPETKVTDKFNTETQNDKNLDKKVENEKNEASCKKFIKEESKQKSTTEESVKIETTQIVHTNTEEANAGIIKSNESDKGSENTETTEASKSVPVSTENQPESSSPEKENQSIGDKKLNEKVETENISEDTKTTSLETADTKEEACNEDKNKEMEQKENKEVVDKIEIQVEGGNSNLDAKSPQKCDGKELNKTCEQRSSENGKKEEKENQKDLANGLGNGSSEEKVTNGDAEGSKEKNIEESADEIKVKKAENSVDATTVSVEV